MLDAVGAGELPDAAQYGDEGSDTLGNIARAVGGLDLPSLEALGLGNVEPLEGCPPQPEGEIAAGVKRHLAAALERAEESPQPDPSTLTHGVYASPEDLDTPHHK